LERFALVLGDSDWTDFLNHAFRLVSEGSSLCLRGVPYSKSWSFRLRGSEAGRFAD
jgi:hypothetical protein